MFMAENPEYKLTNYHDLPYQGSRTLTFQDQQPLEAPQFLNPSNTYNLHNRTGNSTLNPNHYYDLNKLGGRRSSLNNENIYAQSQHSAVNDYNSNSI